MSDITDHEQLHVIILQTEDRHLALLTMTHNRQ